MGAYDKLAAKLVGRFYVNLFSIQRPQVKHAIDCINNNKIASEIHKPEDTILLTELIRQVIKEAGFDVVDTPTGTNFKTV